MAQLKIYLTFFLLSATLIIYSTVTMPASILQIVNPATYTKDTFYYSVSAQELKSPIIRIVNVLLIVS